MAHLRLRITSGSVADFLKSTVTASARVEQLTISDVVYKIEVMMMGSQKAKAGNPSETLWSKAFFYMQDSQRCDGIKHRVTNTQNILVYVLNMLPYLLS